MAIQIINRGPGLGARLGASLGGALQQGLGQGLQNAQQAQALSKVLGISPQEALSYGGLDPQVLKEVIKGKRLKAEEDNLTNALNGFEAYKAGEEFPELSSFSNQTQPSLEQKVFPERKQKAPNLAKMLDLITESKLQNLYQSSGIPQTNLDVPENEIEQVPQVAPQVSKASEKSELQKFRDYIRKNKIALTPSQRKEAESQIIEQEKFNEEKKKNALAETRKYREKVNEEYEVSQDQLRDLDRLEELNKEGKLNGAAWNTFLEESGLNIPALLNPESQEFQKTALGFLRSGRSIFGSRLTDLDVKQLLQMIPTLSQSPKGRARIISSLRRLQRGKELTYKAMRDITRANKGTPPNELREEINDRIKGPLDDLYKKFKKELVAMEKELPEGDSSASIIAAGIGGKILNKFLGKSGGATSHMPLQVLEAATGL